MWIGRFQFHWMDSDGMGLEWRVTGMVHFQFHWMDSKELMAPEGLYSLVYTFNSIEWILQGGERDLSSELRAPFQFHWMDSGKRGDPQEPQPGRKHLSIPLNGFVVDFLTPSRQPVLIAFNSIEWIHMSFKASCHTPKACLLSIPLNGFSFYANHCLRIQWQINLSIPLNGFQ